MHPIYSFITIMYNWRKWNMQSAMKAIYITKTTFRCPLFFGTLLGLQ